MGDLFACRSEPSTGNVGECLLDDLPEIRFALRRPSFLFAEGLVQGIYLVLGYLAFRVGGEVIT